MKILTLLAFGFISMACHAQTYMNFYVTNSTPTSITVPTNTLMTIVNVSGALGGPGSPVYSASAPESAVVTYPNTPSITNGVLGFYGPLYYSISYPYVYSGGPQILRVSSGTTVLGPATVTFNESSYVSDQYSMFLLKFEAVNATPAISGFAVQPSSQTATVTLQSSTNLTTWTTVTNGTYPATNAAKFFRMVMSLTQ